MADQFAAKQPPAADDSLSFSVLNRVDQACLHFESRWQQGSRVSIQAYLAEAAPDERPKLLAELLKLDLHYRALHGETPTSEEYLSQFPEHAPIIHTVFQAHHDTPPPRDLATPPSGLASAGAGLEQHTFRSLRTSSPANLSELVVPGYDILEEVGRGGMGVVYKARQLRLNRIVALKMILSGVHASAEENQRFLTEAEAVAAFSHPNIVEVYEVGQHRNLLYMALEFVEGGNLSDLLLNGPLTAKNAAQLVEQAARGMNAAHQSGFVHRDLKPTNILLGEARNPKITDFGLAKRVDTGAGLTQTGNIVGTPSYMAPEQADGKEKRIGPAVDVYALGAILYECLTSRPPFRGGGALAVLAQVAEEDPRPPRQLKRTIPKDLETICLKCLQKQPDKRYASAVALAEDLRRWQVGEPITARSVGVVERTVKWLKRRPSAAAFWLMVLMLLFVGGMSVARYQQSQVEVTAERERRREKIKTILADVERIRDELHKRLTSAVFTFSNRPLRWTSRIENANSSLQRVEELAENHQQELRDALQQVGELKAWFQRADKYHALCLKLEKVRQDRSAMAEGTFNNADAIRGYAQAFVEANLPIQQVDPQSIAQRMEKLPIRKQLVAALEDWALAAFFLEKTDVTARLLDVAKLADPNPVRNQLRDLELWEDKQQIARVARQLRRDDKALDQLTPQTMYMVGALLVKGREAEEWLQQAQTRYPEDFWLAFLRGNVLARGNKAAAAEGCYRNALALRPYNSAVWNNLGNVLNHQGRREDAIQALRKAIAYDKNVAHAWLNLSVAYHNQKKYDEALAAVRKALTLPPDNAKIWTALSLTLLKLGRIDEAEAALQNARKIEHDSVAVLYQLGHLRRAQQKFDEAERIFQKGLVIDPDEPTLHNSLGVLYCDSLHQFSKAEECFRKAIALDPRCGFYWGNLGNTLHRQSRSDEAILAYETAALFSPRNQSMWLRLAGLRMKQHRLDKGEAALQKAFELDPRNTKLLINIGFAQYKQHKWDEAAATFCKALDINPRFLIAWQNLSVVRFKQRKYAEAEAAVRKIIELRPDMAAAHASLGEALMQQGRFMESLEAFRRALDVRRPNNPDRRIQPGIENRCQQFITLKKILPAVLSGKRQVSAREALVVADFCFVYLKRYSDAVHLFKKGLPLKATNLIDLKKSPYCKAAKAAVLAAAGQDCRGRPMTHQEGTDLCRLAQQWLAAGLTAHTEQAALGNPAPLLRLQEEILPKWRDDPNLEFVREPAEIAKLPKEEQQAWQAFWSAFAKLEEKVQTVYRETKYTGTLTVHNVEKTYTLKMTAGKVYVIDMRSKQLDPVLRLQDVKGKRLIQNNNIAAPENYNARITFTPKQDGTYHLITGSFRKRGRGTYEIIIREFAGKNPSVTR